MADIKELLETLKQECKDERDCFKDEKRREFFIELVNVGNLDELLEKYDPQTHNNKWAAEYMKKIGRDIDVLMQEKRAVDFMSSGKLGCIRHYKDNELRSHVMGIARMHWDHQILAQTKDFVTMDFGKN